MSSELLAPVADSYGTLRSFIGGDWTGAEGAAKLLDIENPATLAKIGEVPLSGAQVVDDGPAVIAPVGGGLSVQPSVFGSVSSRCWKTRRSSDSVPPFEIPTTSDVTSSLRSKTVSPP